MLVLTRKRDESIRIGSNIVIRVIRTSNGSVKLGIDAPATVKIMRGELATFEELNAADIFAQNEGDLMEDCALEALFVQN